MAFFTLIGLHERFNWKWLEADTWDWADKCFIDEERGAKVLKSWWLGFKRICWYFSMVKACKLTDRKSRPERCVKNNGDVQV